MAADTTFPAAMPLLAPVPSILPALLALLALAPGLLMLVGAASCLLRDVDAASAWRRVRWLAAAGTACALAQGLLAGMTGRAGAVVAGWPGLVVATGFWPWMAGLVQALAGVIAAFSSRYLRGEPGQPRRVAAFAGVVASVQGLLLADHWVVLVAAWAAVGACLQPLLCFYADRPFARLAAHKKRLADRVADLMLLLAAALAWHDLGSGSLSALFARVSAAGGPASPLLSASAVCLVLAVILRTALFPVHGWLVQVMEAPTPVSALLHAGVVNLGGFVLVRFAPLLAAVPLARGLLVGAGLLTAVAAGLVSLTRISIKVRLAWSTVAQMGFMVLECGLGLYTLAALHLLGHSLYKAQAFLSASSAVDEARAAAMRGRARPAGAGLVAAPVLVGAIVLAGQRLAGADAWPGWWSGVLALAWAPMLWWPAAAPTAPRRAAWSMAAWSLSAGVAAVAVLTAAALLAMHLPLGVLDAPWHEAGPVALAGMASLHLALLVLQRRPSALETLRRWSYAGFHVDEAYTRLALALWPTTWGPRPRAPARARSPGWRLASPASR